MWTGIRCKEAIEHPHTQAREMMVHCEHPTAGDLYFQGCVTKMSETPGVVETPSPLLGEHNRDLWINRRRRSTVKRRRRNLITFYFIRRSNMRKKYLI